MIQEQAQAMICNITQNIISLVIFCKKGYFSYTNSESNCRGNVAIVPNKAIISFLEDIEDDAKVVATVKFKEGKTLIYKLFDEDYSYTEYGQNNTQQNYSVRIPNMQRKDIIQDITTIRKYCEDAKNKGSNKSNNEISFKDTIDMLEDTLDKLSKSRHLNEKQSEQDRAR